MAYLLFILYTIVAVVLIRVVIIYAPAAVLSGAAVIIALPFMPFITAWRIRKGKPFMAKTLMALWSLVYVSLTFLLLFS